MCIRDRGIAGGDISASIDKFGASFTMSGSNFNIPLDTEISLRKNEDIASKTLNDKKSKDQLTAGIKEEQKKTVKFEPSADKGKDKEDKTEADEAKKVTKVEKKPSVQTLNTTPQKSDTKPVAAAEVKKEATKDA